jgi:hypothetical protein
MPCRVLGAPPDVETGLQDSGVAEPDLVLAFAPDRATLAGLVPKLLDLYGFGGRLWIAYPKKTGKLRSDLDRDHGWEPMISSGLLPVTQVALDDNWSALRFRFREEIPRITRQAG